MASDKEQDRRKRLALELIKKHEGFQAGVYKDPTGNPTMGFGVRGQDLSEADKDQSGDLSPQEAEQQALEQLAKHQSFKNRLLKQISPEQEAVLTSVEYNAGSRATKPITDALNKGDMAAARQALLDINKAKDRETGEWKELPGLVKRRQEEADYGFPLPSGPFQISEEDLESINKAIRQKEAAPAPSSGGQLLDKLLEYWQKPRKVEENESVR